jgi:hypothetical protein
MHPDLARSLYDQRRAELTAQMPGRRAYQARGARRARRVPQARQYPQARQAAGVHGFRRWSVSWTRLSPGDMPGAPAQPRSSWMIIISAGRPG